MALWRDYATIRGPNGWGERVKMAGTSDRAMTASVVPIDLWRAPTLRHFSCVAVPGQQLGRSSRARVERSLPARLSDECRTLSILTPGRRETHIPSHASSTSLSQRGLEMNDAATAGLFGAPTIVGLAIAAVIGILIGKDAQSRGMSGAGWGIFSFLICIIAVPIYLVVRKPRLDERK
jgi:hypothetical protein